MSITITLDISDVGKSDDINQVIVRDLERLIWKLSYQEELNRNPKNKEISAIAAAKIRYLNQLLDNTKLTIPKNCILDSVHQYYPCPACGEDTIDDHGRFFSYCGTCGQSLNHVKPENTDTTLEDCQADIMREVSR